MPDLCPICSEKLEAAITFSQKTFKVCFPCNYISEPEQATMKAWED